MTQVKVHTQQEGVADEHQRLRLQDVAAVRQLCGDTEDTSQVPQVPMLPMSSEFDMAAVGSVSTVRAAQHV
jgi:hypothetical protein